MLMSVLCRHDNHSAFTAVQTASRSLAPPCRLLQALSHFPLRMVLGAVSCEAMADLIRILRVAKLLNRRDLINAEATEMRANWV